MKFGVNLVLIFLTSILFFELSAKEKIVVMPVAAKGRGESKLALEVDEDLRMLYEELTDADLLFYKAAVKKRVRKKITACRRDFYCLHKITNRKKSSLFTLIPSIKKEKSVRIISLTLYKKSGKKIFFHEVEMDLTGGSADIAAELFTEIRGKVVSKVSGKLSGKDLLKLAFDLYKKGDMDAAVKNFGKANEKSLAGSVVSVRESLKKAAQHISSGELEIAENLLENAKVKDDGVRDEGHRKLRYKKELVERYRHKQYSSGDVEMLMDIHASFKDEYVALLKWRESEMVKIEVKTKRERSEQRKRIVEFERGIKRFEAERGEEKRRFREKKSGIEKKKKSFAKVTTGKIKSIERKIDNIEKKEIGIDLKKKKESRIDDANRVLKKNIATLEDSMRRFEKRQQKALALLKGKLLKSIDKLERRIGDHKREIVNIENLILKYEADVLQKVKSMEVLNKHEQRIAADEDLKYREAALKSHDSRRVLLENDLDRHLKKVESGEQTLLMKEKELKKLLLIEDEKLRELQTWFFKRREKLDRDFDKDLARSISSAESEFEKTAEKKRAEIEKKEAEIVEVEDRYENYKRMRKYKKLVRALKRKIVMVEKFENRRSFFITKAEKSAKAKYVANMDLLETERAKKKIRIIKNVRGKAEAAKEKIAMAESKLGLLKERHDKLTRKVAKELKASEKEIGVKIAKREKRRFNENRKRAQRRAREKKRVRLLVKKLRSKKVKINRSISILEVKVKKSLVSNDKLLSRFGKRQAKERAKVEKSHRREIKKFEAVFHKHRRKADRVYLKERGKREKKREAELSKLRKKIYGLKSAVEKRGDKLDDDLIKERKALQKRVAKIEYLRAKEIKKLEKMKEVASHEDAAIGKRREKSKKSVEKVYAGKREKIVDKEFRKMKVKYGKTYVKEYQHRVDNSDATVKIRKMYVRVQILLGKRAMDEGRLGNARVRFSKALYYSPMNREAKKGLKKIAAIAGALYRQAINMIDSSPAEAKTIFRKLVKSLRPTNRYFVKAALALNDLK